MTRKVEVVCHNPEWHRLFEDEVKELTAVLGKQVVAAHHIGSTAISGIVAKPIIDVLLEVRDVARLDAFNEEMVESGYLPKGESGISGRRFFIKGTEVHRTHHIHAFREGHPAVHRHLAFRDYLRAHPDEASAYGHLKRELARRFRYDIDAYVAGKDEFIKEIERRAVVWKRTRTEEDSI